MSVHFRILSADGITLLDQPIAEANGSVGLPVGEVRRLLDETSGGILQFVVEDPANRKPKHKLPVDWSILDG